MYVYNECYIWASNVISKGDIFVTNTITSYVTRFGIPKYHRERYSREICNGKKRSGVYTMYKSACVAAEPILNTSMTLPMLQTSVNVDVRKYLNGIKQQLDKFEKDDLSDYILLCAQRDAVSRNKDALDTLRKRYSFDTTYPMLFGVDIENKAIIKKRTLEDKHPLDFLRECIARRIEYHRYCQIHATNYKVEGHVIQILLQIKLLDKLTNISKQLDYFVTIYVQNRETFKVLSNKMLALQEEALKEQSKELLQLKMDKSRYTRELAKNSGLYKQAKAKHTEATGIHMKTGTKKTKNALAAALARMNTALAAVESTERVIQLFVDSIATAESKLAETSNTITQLEADIGLHDTEYTEYTEDTSHTN